MRKTFLIICLSFLGLVGCSQKKESNKTILNLTINEKEIELYDLEQKDIEIDNGIIKFFIPKNWKEIEIEPNFGLAYFYINDGKDFYSIQITELESSITTSVKSAAEYLELNKDAFQDQFGGDKTKIAEILPPSLTDVKVLNLDYDLKIEGRRFFRRYLYYIDQRNKGTELEGKTTTDFSYFTWFNGKKYSFIVNYIGEKDVSRNVGLASSIASSIKFIEK